METPQEKALELVNKFSAVGLQMRDEGITCALIAVDEMLYEHFGDDSEYGTRRYFYLLEVKLEIEKL